MKAINQYRRIKTKLRKTERKQQRKLKTILQTKF